MGEKEESRTTLRSFILLIAQKQNVLAQAGEVTTDYKLQECLPSVITSDTSKPTDTREPLFLPSPLPDSLEFLQFEGVP